MSWPHWGSFWFGVLCAYAVPWIVVISVVGVCCAVRDWLAKRRQRARGRRALRAWVAQRTFGNEAALTAPGASPDDVLAARAAHQARRDAQAVEALLRSLPREA